jgi:hypothetical protein
MVQVVQLVLLHVEIAQRQQQIVLLVMLQHIGIVQILVVLQLVQADFMQIQRRDYVIIVMEHALRVLDLQLINVQVAQIYLQ